MWAGCRWASVVDMPVASGDTARGRQPLDRMIRHGLPTHDSELHIHRLSWPYYSPMSRQFIAHIARNRQGSHNKSISCI